jgi:hypothetical protein
MAPARASRSARPAARRKKTPRFRPRAPEDFFSVEAWQLLTDELKTRARDWQVNGLPRLFYYGPDSEPAWGDAAHCRLRHNPAYRPPGHAARRHGH